MSLHRRQKVICIDASISNRRLTQGGVYEITCVDGGFVKVAETRGACWYADRFRPAVSRKTDISIFTAMLTPSAPEIVA